jgi:hypothetical protein
MALVEPTAGDQEMSTKATMEQVLPGWGESCNEGFAECTSIWNATVGKVRGIELN